MAIVYSVEQLADLAKKGEIPEFVYTNFERSKELLLGYPRSLENWEERAIFPVALTMIMVPGILFFCLSVFNPMHLNGWHVIIPGLLVVSTIFFICMFIIRRLTTRSSDHYHDAYSVENLGKSLRLLSDITGYTPGQLSSARPRHLRNRAERVMVEACKKVVICQEQNAQADPTEWRLRHEKLMDDVSLKYDAFRKFDLVNPDGYARFYRLALKELHT